MGKKAETLAARMRRLRMAAGMTQQRLAEVARLSIAIIGSIEGGRTPNPRVNTALAIAKALGVGLSELVEGRAEK
jgi:transcriptional regulator with XRE-family HTH domain